MSGSSLNQELPAELLELLQAQFLPLLEALVLATPSDLCISWIKELGIANETPTPEQRAKNLADRTSSAQWRQPFPPLTGENYLRSVNHNALVVLLAEQVPPVIDPLGYEGWDPFFQMLPSWKGYLDELPGVITSLLAGK